MKIKIELDLTPEEAKELFVPGDKQNEFMLLTYNAYAQAVSKTLWEHVDPYDFTGLKKNASKN